MANAEGKEAKKALRWVIRYLMAEKKVFVPSMIALFVTAMLSLAFPWFLKNLIGETVDGLRDGLAAAHLQRRANSIIGGLMAVLALQATISYFRVRGFIHAGESALNSLRLDVFRHVMRLPMSTFDEQRAGALSNRVSADLGVVREALLTTVPQAIRHTVILVGGLIFVFIASWKLSLIMLGSVPIVVAAIAFFGKRVRTHSRDAQDALAESGVVIEESVQGITNVKAFTNEGLENSRYEANLQEYFRIVSRGGAARAGFLAFIIFALFGTIAFVAWYGAGMLAKGEINSENFTSFVLFSIFVGASLGSIPEIVSQLQQTSGASERLHALFESPFERADGRADVALAGGIRFRGVSFAYPSRPAARVLQELDFEVAPGSRIALVGPSGAGKSTVFSLILGFHHPLSGGIEFDGHPADSLALSCLRSQIGVVQQEVLLFGGTIAENIAYGKPGCDQHEIEAAARQANAHDFIASLPEGYATMVGPRGTKLSGGQRQRVAIARAILANPKILLLDEATSALDSESERLVNEALERLMVGRTSLVIAHRLSTVRHADCILVMKQGRLVESGSHDELLERQGIYRFLVETQLT